MGKLVGILVTLSAFIFLGCGGSAKPKIEKPRVHQSIIDLERGKIKGQDYGAFETKNLQKIYDLVIPHLGKGVTTLYDMRKYRFISQRQLRYISSQTFITASIRSQPGALERVLLVEIDKDADLQKLKMEADRKANNKTIVNEKAQKVLSGKKWGYIDDNKNPIDIKKEIEKVKKALKGAEDFSVIVSPHYAFRDLEMINSWYVQGGGSERDLADTYIGWEKQRVMKKAKSIFDKRRVENAYKKRFEEAYKEAEYLPKYGKPVVELEAVFKLDEVNYNIDKEYFAGLSSMYFTDVTNLQFGYPPYRPVVTKTTLPKVLTEYSKKNYGGVDWSKRTVLTKLKTTNVNNVKAPFKAKYAEKMLGYKYAKTKRFIGKLYFKQNSVKMEDGDYHFYLGENIGYSVNLTKKIQLSNKAPKKLKRVDTKNPVGVVDNVNKLVWTYSKQNIYEHESRDKGARTTCRVLSLYGDKNWRLPTEKEFRALKNASDNKIFSYYAPYVTDDSDSIGFSANSKNDRYTHDHHGRHDVLCVTDLNNIY